jgi:hypothetical protein
VEWDALSLDHSAVDILPLDVEKPLSRYRLLEVVDNLDRLVPFDSRWQDKLVGRRRSAERTTGCQEQRRGPREPRLGETSRPIGPRTPPPVSPRAYA